MAYDFARRVHCRSCGDYWQEDEWSAMCPECGSLDVEDVDEYNKADQ